MGVETEETTDLREILEAAVAEEPTTEVETPAPVGEETPTETPPEKGAVRERDAHGRFAKGEKPPEGEEEEEIEEKPPEKALEPKPGEPKPGEKPPEKAQFRPPQSWKPTAREKLASADPEIQHEVTRREAEMTRYMQETAQARREADAFNRMSSQFAFLYAPLGASPIQAAEDLFRTAALLRTSPPQQKAMMLAAMINTALPGKEGIELLDAALSGQQPVGPGPQGFPRDPRVDQLLATLAQNKRALEEQGMAETRADLEAFASGHDFYEDVKDTMADLMERALRKKVVMSKEDAYNRACELDPDISKILAQRKQVAAARTATAATQRSQRAAGSVRGTPASGMSPEGATGEDLRSTLEEVVKSAR